jgi:hypothetical protein
MSKKLSIYLIISLLVIALAACAPPNTPPSRQADAAPAGNQAAPQAEAAPADVPIAAEAAPPASPDGSTSTPGTAPAPATGDLTYPIVDTGQAQCYDDQTGIACPDEGEAFHGQDAQITGNAPSYTDNGDGTVTDNVTGLMWQQSPDTNEDGQIGAPDKLSYAEAGVYCENLTLAGYDDWRLPDIKTLYSLMDFRGLDPTSDDTSAVTPFIDTQYFAFGYGDMNAGERIIDAQFASSTLYVATVMNGSQAMFGLNLADGRIKGYPQNKTFYVLCVRGNESYGQNDFVDNGDGTITDNATGLTWSQDDSGSSMDWGDALAWVEQKNAENYLGYSDWRLPNAKELQSLVDYTRSPDTTDSAAIDPLFNATAITNEAGQPDYGFYWSSTTHANLRTAGNAAYVAFGRGLGSMDGTHVIDVHGAGCQRSDPKSDDGGQYPSWGHGPQGDLRRASNFVRLVRGGDATATPADDLASTADGGDQAPAERTPPSGETGEAPQGGPPQEAIDACVGLAENATCTVDTPDGQLTGTCALLQQELVCVPRDHTPPK